jgi:hypothetical protein
MGLTTGRSLTTPTVAGQKLAMDGAYSRANIDVDSVSCILSVICFFVFLFFLKHRG